jgi:8-oxo-dGTP pyrophosphatase MutT (NUDIX family)
MTSTFSYTQPFILIGALIERDGKFLVLEENHGDAKGLWNIPSGKLNLGESLLDCARREVKEESGLDFEPERIVSIRSMVRKPGQTEGSRPSHTLRIIYSGKFSGKVSFEHNDYDEAGDREMSSYRWVTPAEVGALPLRQPDIPDAIERYLAGKFLPLDTVEHTEWARAER